MGIVQFYTYLVKYCYFDTANRHIDYMYLYRQAVIYDF